MTDMEVAIGIWRTIVQGERIGDGPCRGLPVVEMIRACPQKFGSQPSVRACWKFGMWETESLYPRLCGGPQSQGASQHVLVDAEDILVFVAQLLHFLHWQGGISGKTAHKPKHNDVSPNGAISKRPKLYVLYWPS